jgi:hypothetical protein
MHLPSALLVTRLAIGVLAIYPVDGTNYGIESDLIAAPLAPGARVANEVYNHCKELDQDSVQVSDGEECIWNALHYMIQALNDAQSTMRVALLSNTVDNMQSIAYSPHVNTAATMSWSSSELAPSEATSPPSKSKRQDESAREVFLQRLNDQIHGRSEDGHRPRAVHFGQSEEGLTDGLAIRTNVRSGDTILHVHTNGSHALAAFTRDALPRLGHRDAASMPGSEYRFEGAQGLKLQIRAGDEQAHDMLSTLLFELAHGKDEMAPKLKDSDSWALVLCRRSTEELMLQGKLIMEDDGAGHDWESGGLIDCKS